MGYVGCMLQRTIDANGLQFSMLEWGEGPLVLCFHGFPDDAHTWDVVGPGIAAAGYRVIAPFLRGYSPSGLPSKDTDSRTLGEDVLALIRSLGPARLVGHDWGAEAVYAAAGLDSSAIQQMVTIAIPPRAAVPFSPGLLWAIRHFVTLRLPGAEGRFAADDFSGIEMFWRRWSPTWKYTAEELQAVKETFAKPGVVHAALGYYRAAQFLPADFLRKPISVPTLMIAGGDDPGVSPQVFEASRKQFSGHCQVVTVPGGHFCHRESPKEVVEAIVAFLNGGITRDP